MKRFRTVVIVVLLCLVAAELTALLAYRVVSGRWFSPQQAADARARVVAEAPGIAGPSRGGTTALVAHPFIGFVYDPAYDPEGTKRVHGVPASPWGFLDDKAPVRPAAADEAVIAITGGSVAFWFSVQGVTQMLAELAEVPRFRGRRLIVVRTALGGSKQPQQLMTLSYLLSMGAHFDAVINLDGFNEIALPPATLIPHGVFPFFPRDWPGMLGAAGGPERLRVVGEITYLRRQRGRLAVALDGAPWRWSPLAATFWTLRDRAIAREIASLQMVLAAPPPSAAPGAALDFASGGPRRNYATTEAMYADLAAVWHDSSLQMHRLAAANGIEYFHFLQPNQYVAGSKPMSARERDVALLPNGPFAAHVQAGYPALLARGRDLTAEGVRFFDLTGLFAGIDAPLYVDDCCHVSAAANELMGRQIGRSIAAVLRR